MPASRTAHSHDVVTIGAAVIDLYATSPSFELSRKPGAPDGWAASLPLGSKLELTDLVMETGGGATNTAVTFARLGLRAAAICRVGKGLNGDFVVRRLKEERIDATCVQRDGSQRTGQSVILVAGAGYRTILVHRGASAELDARRIPWGRLSPRWFYATSLAGDLGTISLMLDRAERAGSRVAWNPGAHELEKGLKHLTPLLRRTDVLVLNREEAALLAGKPLRHLKDILNTLGELPKIALLVSDGDRGAYLTSRGCTWYSPSLPGARTNTTGAGDALGSGFVAGFLETCDPALGLQMGMLNAFGVITHMGAHAGIMNHWPTMKELKRVKLKPPTF